MKRTKFSESQIVPRIKWSESGMKVDQLCRAMGIPMAGRTLTFQKSIYYYRSLKDDSEAIDKLLELSVAKPREGHDKYYQRIRLEGHKWNKKRVKESLVLSDGPNMTWSLNFMSDSLAHGRRFRTFNIIDDFNRMAYAERIY